MRVLHIALSLVIVSGFKGSSQTFISKPGVSPITEVTQSIVRNCHTDSAKAYAIFKWMTQNIAYDAELYLSNGDYISKFPEYPDTSDHSQQAYTQWYEDQVATYVLKEKKGICYGYAQLYKAMCRNAGIICNSISGYVNKLESIGLPREVSHAWNVVKYKDKWHLVDVTWASGHLDEDNRFVRAYNAHYYDTPPEAFINDHYPEDASYIFLPVIPPLTRFFEKPHIWPYFAKSGITDYWPQNGRIMVKNDTVIEFRITFKDQPIVLTVTESPGNKLLCYLPYKPPEVAAPTITAHSRKKFESKVNDKEKKEQDAIMAYINSMEDTTVNLPPEEAIPAKKEKEIEVYKLEGKSMIFRYHCGSKDPKRITFFLEHHCILSYDIIHE